MIITVSVPQTHILHTASLEPASPEAFSHGSTVAVVGQPLATTLRIKHTRQWASPNSLVTAANLTSPTDPIDFVYSLEANPETWLVAGPRRAHFSAKDDEEHTFPLMLIPLRAGTTLLPSVDIRARIAPKSEEKRSSSTVAPVAEEEEDHLNCETDLLSSGEVVHVVPDVRESTVGIGDMGRSGSTVWLEAESR